MDTIYLLRWVSMASSTRSCFEGRAHVLLSFSEEQRDTPTASLRRYDPGQVQRVGRYGPLSPCQEAPLATPRRNRVAGRLSTGDRYKAL